MNDARPDTSGTYRVTVEGSEPQVFELSRELLEPADDQLVADTVGPGAGQGDRTDGFLTVLKRPGEPGATLTRYEVVVGGWRFLVGVEPAARAELRERGSRTGKRDRSAGRQIVRAQIPGRIAAVAVAVGEAVAAGQLLLVVEAMKMENAVVAPWAGTIARIGLEAGQTVELGDELVVIE
jgi:biotin carboxyl carrier protein